MNQAKGYYCPICEKDLCEEDLALDGSLTIQGVYDPAKIEISFDVYCDECKTLLGMEVGRIIMGDLLPRSLRRA